jgi:precorrin-2 dehydrogenase/sirohydrochlorin ferrochelatase
LVQYYPIFLRVAGRPCAVIGGGRVGERKVVSLLDAGAEVTVISPELTPGLATMAGRGLVRHRARRYREGDLEGFFLVYAATNDDRAHAEIAQEAATAGVLLNVVDRPQLCTFIVPSILERGDLTVAVSTAGGSPALARRVRLAIDAALGPEYEQALTLLARLRDRLRASSLSASDRQQLFTQLVESELLDHLRAGDAAAVDALLARYAGTDCSLASLGMEMRGGSARDVSRKRTWN